MSIPLVDLRAQYQRIKKEIDAAVGEVLESQQFIDGPQVAALETEIAQYVGVPHAVGVASGTDALLLALKAAGVKPGDEVITTPFTFFATAGAIHNAGARPVFVDINPATFNMSPSQLEDVITERTRAVIPVHLFGQCGDMDPILAFAERRELIVIEDAAQSLGARYRDRPAGAMGDAGAVSFFPSKNLGGAGDGGMVTTRHDSLARTVCLLRNHGQNERYQHAIVGVNSRLDAIQAAVLRVKLKHLDLWAEERRAHATYYTKRFAEMEEVAVPRAWPECYHVYNQYTIRLPRRDDAEALLRERGIGCAVYYRVPLHLQECFSYLGYRTGDFPETERACEEVLSLPVYPELTREQQDDVIRALADHLARSR